MTETRFDYKNSRWADKEQVPRWCEELERHSQEGIRDHLRQRLLSGSSGDIKFGDVSMPSEFVEDWLAWHENAQRRLQREHVENERVIARWTRTLGWFTRALAAIGALALVTSILTAVILYWTDQTSRLRDRAFLYFGDPHVTQYPPNNPIVWGVSITVANAGNMPAPCANYFLRLINYLRPMMTGPI
jgi:hypothetical protein